MKNRNSGFHSYRNRCLTIKMIIVPYGLIIKYKDKNAMYIEKCASASVIKKPMH